MDSKNFSSTSQELDIKARVIRSVTAQLDEEIDLLEDEVVTVTDIIDDTWYRGFIGERIGIFPSSHVELLDNYSESLSKAVSCASHSENYNESSSISSRQIYKQCVVDSTSDIGSSVSARQIYKQCVDDSTSDIGSSVSARQIYKQCVDDSTSDIGSIVSARQIYKQCVDDSTSDMSYSVSARQIYKQCVDDSTSEMSLLVKHMENDMSKNVMSFPHVTEDSVPHGITLYPFCAQFDNELNFHEGEIINLIRYIDKYWMEGEISGKKGIFPANYVKILVDCKNNLDCEALAKENEDGSAEKILVNACAVVKYNFDAQMKSDLSVIEGEKVWVIELINNDWCQIQNNAGQIGLVPCVYLSQVISDGIHSQREDSGACTIDLHDQTDSVTVSECVEERTNTVCTGSSNSAHSSEAMNIDTAMSRNLAELSLSARYGSSSNSVTTSKEPRHVNILDGAVHDQKPDLQAPADNTYLRHVESLTFGLDEAELRGGKGSTSQRRESSDRIPHRPAPPAPVCSQQVSDEGVTSEVQLDASVADTSTMNVAPDVEVTQDTRTEDERTKNIEQRQNVISELVYTEKEFSRDMKITYETFNLHNPNFLESYGVDVKLLFGNILEVIHLSEDFTDELLLSLKGKSEENQCVGRCFLNIASRMKSVYSEYTVNHDNVSTLLEKYDSDPAIKTVLDKGLETLRYQISCFDMGSILIKPVQRVLKYPLIVNELIKYTEENHEDKCDLLKAASAMMDVAKDINENKRRKDIVIKYLEDNPLTISSRISRMTLHSVAKKSNRIGALLSSSLGIKTGARDELYDEQESLFYNLDKMVRSFLKNAETFVASLQETFFIKGLIVENIVSLYDEDTTTEVDMYCKIVKNISSQFVNEFKRTFESRVSIPLSMLLKCFEGPWKLVQKRYDKLLDYEAFFSRMDKTKDNRQGTINIMKNTFIALNNQLTEELPLLITLACEVFAECVKAFVLARKLLMGKITKQYLALFSEIYEDNHFNDESLDTFVTKHTLAWSQLINLPSLTRQPKYDGGVGSTYKFFPLSATDSVSASIASAGIPMTSQQAYLHSYYDSSSLYQVIENYNAKENLELTVSEGQLVAVIKKQNPMGDPKIWFVDNGATQGFVPSSCLILLHNDAVGQSVIDQATDQKVQLPDISHGSTKQGLYEASDEADNPPSYATVVSSGVNEENEPFYEEVKDDELFYVLHDLTSSDDHVLKASRGQVVKVLHKEDYDGNSEWWFVEDNLKNTGYVPANYLSKCNFN